MTVINLIPAEVRHAATRRAHLLRWMVVVAASGVLAAIPYSLSLARDAQLSKLHDEVESIDGQATMIRSQLRLVTGQAQQLHSDLERSQALRAKRAWSGMFALIASSLPPDCWLHSVATDPEAPTGSAVRPPTVATAPGAPPTPESVTIEAPRKLLLVGYSTSDSKPLVFVSNLRESKAFAHVALQKATRARSEKDAGALALYQFEVVCEW